jgi:hypothetical protein
MTVKAYGPYADKSKDGRKKMTIVDNKTGKHTSTNAARYSKEKALGRKLPKNVDVDHADNNKHNDGAKNLKVMSHSKNVAKGNKHRTKKK